MILPWKRLRHGRRYVVAPMGWIGHENLWVDGEGRSCICDLNFAFVPHSGLNESPSDKPLNCVSQTGRKLLESDTVAAQASDHLFFFVSVRVTRDYKLNLRPNFFDLAPFLTNH